MASPNGSARGVTRGLPVVSAATMLPPVTSNSKASPYVRSTTLLPSGERAAPVTSSRPGLPSLFSVLVLGRVTSPTFFIGMASGSPLLLNFAVGVKISDLPDRSLVMTSGRLSSPTSSASASCGSLPG
ncbi:hypothetical protein B0E53_05395 [Micromonospora sp. MH33]|nr:hypothetical protein B0E53_05395 [Micromonospora sp. MH33]